jgi:RNA polymerase primary sigma factor
MAEKTNYTRNSSPTQKCDPIVDYFIEQANKYPTLTVEKERTLTRRIKDHRRPEDISTLVLHNLQYAISLAKKYRKLGVEFPDLIQSAYIGLTNAAQKYDIDAGIRDGREPYKFVSFAKVHIIGTIFDELKINRKTVREPGNFIHDAKKVIKQEELLTQILGREPDLEEITDLSGIPLKTVKDVIFARNNTKSLDKPYDDENKGRNLLSVLPNPAHDVTSEKRKQAVTILSQIVENMGDERISEILLRHFGIGELRDPDSLKLIGASFGITRERTRQLKEQGLAKLRQSITPKEKIELAAALA